MKRLGVYPGTFDPLTFGHMDIIRRASKLVDHLFIGVSDNSSGLNSKSPMFSADERIHIIKEEVGKIGISIEVVKFSCLLVDFVKQVNAQVIIRGLRAIADFEYELQMAGMNSMLDPSTETLFLISEPRYQAISSRLVKEVAALGGDISVFVPHTTSKYIHDKMNQS